jgi:hypothetical protein
MIRRDSFTGSRNRTIGYGHIVPGSNRNAVNRLGDEGDFGLRVVGAAG